MKRLSLQWRITLLTALLIAATCLTMQILLSTSGIRYMNSIGDFVQGYGQKNADSDPAFFDPELAGLGQDLTIVVQDAQEGFRLSSWCLTGVITVLGAVLAYFISGHALKPFRSFAGQVEKIQSDNLADLRLNEELMPEFRKLSQSFNQMLERLNSAFAAQSQFSGNAAHELRTPLALMQAQLELFSAEHPTLDKDTENLLLLLSEQTERLSQVTKTLLEMSHLKSLARTDKVDIGPMIEEIFTDLSPLAEEKAVTMERSGEGVTVSSDTLLYRLFFNLIENAVKYNRPGGSIQVKIAHQEEKLSICIKDTGYGIPLADRQNIFQPFFRVDKSRSRAAGGVGLGLSLVWEIVRLHGGCVWVEDSSDQGTTMVVQLPV